MQNLYERRSCRNFKSTPVPKEMIEQILKAGRSAPNSLGAEQISFYVVTNKELLTTIVKEAKKSCDQITGLQGFDENSFIYGSPCVILMTTPKDDQTWSQYDCGCCAENMCTAAEILGLGSIVLGILQPGQVAIKKLLKIDDNEEMLMSVAIGYSNDSKKSYEKKLTSKVAYFE